MTRAFVEDLSQEDTLELIGQLEQNMRSGCCDASIWHVLLSIAKYSRLQVVREFYRKAYGFFLWSYPLKALKEKVPPLDWAAEAFTEDMIASLKDNDANRCAAAMKDLFMGMLGMAETYLLKQGLRPDEIWLCRSIRFLAMEHDGADERK